eukprot:763250-Hanusia_phi.AAC.6
MNNQPEKAIKGMERRACAENVAPTRTAEAQDSVGVEQEGEIVGLKGTGGGGEEEEEWDGGGTGSCVGHDNNERGKSTRETLSSIREKCTCPCPALYMYLLK